MVLVEAEHLRELCYKIRDFCPVLSRHYGIEFWKVARSLPFASTQSICEKCGSWQEEVNFKKRKCPPRLKAKLSCKRVAAFVCGVCKFKKLYPLPVKKKRKRNIAKEFAQEAARLTSSKLQAVSRKMGARKALDLSLLKKKPKLDPKYENLIAQRKEEPKIVSVSVKPKQDSFDVVENPWAPAKRTVSLGKKRSLDGHTKIINAIPRVSGAETPSGGLAKSTTKDEEEGDMYDLLSEFGI